MNIVNKDFLFNLMQEKDLKFFCVFGYDGKSKLFEQDESNVSTGDAIHQLSSCMDAMEDGQIIKVELCQVDRANRQASSGNTRKSREVYEFRVRCGKKPGITGTPVIDTSLVNTQHLQLLEKIKQLELQLEKKEHEHRIKEIERKLEEKNEESPLEKYLPIIINGLGWGGAGAALATAAQKQPVTGIAGTESETEATPKQKITDAVNRLLKVDKDLPNTLQTLATFAEKDPNKYLSFLPILKTM